MRKKFGWTVKGIVGLIFSLVGLPFLIVSLVCSQVTSDLWRNPDDFFVFEYIFGGMGILFLIIGLALLAADIHRRRQLQRAFDGGNCVEAEILGVRTQNNVNMNGRHPVVVECAYTDASGVVHVYRSRYLYIDITNLLKSKTVPVYIDRYNENIGFVDIDAVLPEIRVHG